MTADTAALRALLPEIEKAGERLEDETLGRVICALRGVSFKYSTCNFLDNLIVGYDSGTYCCPRDRCPDVDLTAAAKLCEELGYRKRSTSAMFGAFAEALVWQEVDPPAPGIATHLTSEPIAILIALSKALIAEGEGFHVSSVFPGSDTSTTDQQVANEISRVVGQIEHGDFDLLPDEGDE